MDSLDTEILKNLRCNGRISHEELSKKLSISRPSIHQRVSKLEREEVIKGYITLINWEKLDKIVIAFVNIKIVPSDFQNAVNSIVKSEVENVIVEDCYRLSGEWCIALKVRANSPKDISRLIDALSKINGVKETSTTFVLSTIMESGISD